MATKQIFARIGAGTSAMGALIWVLWPQDWSTVLQPEPIFAFAVAYCVWLSTEIFNGENYSTVPPTKNDDQVRLPLSENDLKCSRQVLSYHKYTMRDLLKQQDLGGYFDYRYMSELHAFVHANDEDQFEFLDEKIDERWRPVAKKFKEFGHFMAVNSTPDHIGQREMVRLDHHRVALMIERAEDKPSIADQGNELASEAWGLFDQFVGFLKTNYPETTGGPEGEPWFYTRRT